MTNYLHYALMTPDRTTLVLSPSYNDPKVGARSIFCSYLNEAMRFGLIVKEIELRILFPQGGYIRFGVIEQPIEISRYMGYDWCNVFADKLSPELSRHCINVLL